jgi:oligopeptide/dipeptide ABC transporter ATP-binding protein
MGMSILLITHDLGVVAEFVDHVVVMYAGKVVERADTRALFATPRHPYTRGLLRSVPSYADNARRPRLPTIPGVVPDLRSLGSGCRFRERCAEAIDVCALEEPPLVTLAGDARDPRRQVACHVAAATLAAPAPSPVVTGAST